MKLITSKYLGITNSILVQTFKYKHSSLSSLFLVILSDTNLIPKVKATLLIKYFVQGILCSNYNQFCKFNVRGIIVKLFEHNVKIKLKWLRII